MLKWVAAHAEEFGADGSRIAVAGNSVGGNMSAALTLMAKDRGGPKISYQVLMIPATDASVDTGSYHEFGTGRFLARAFMKSGWDLYAPDAKTRDNPYVSPLRASLQQLQGLPPALVVTSENDPLRDEGRSLRRKLKEAGGHRDRHPLQRDDPRLRPAERHPDRSRGPRRRSVRYRPRSRPSGSLIRRRQAVGWRRSPPYGISPTLNSYDLREIRQGDWMSSDVLESPEIDVGRRRLLLGAAAGVTAGWAASFLPARAEPAPVILRAGRRTIDVNGKAASVFDITQPDGTQGLTTEAGKRFQVDLHNECGVETLIHWHGLNPPYRQDGVPGLSAPPIPPGGLAQYDFPLDFGGTYWMHSHVGLQEQLLMSAPLIVREPGDVADRQEVVLMLRDFSFRSPEEIFDGLRHPASATMDMSAMGGTKGGAMPGMTATPTTMPPAMDLNDVAYDAFLANDRTLRDPQIVRVERGGRVLLRVINGSAASNFRIDLAPLRAILVAVDGHRVEPVAGRSFPIGIAQRIDLALELSAEHPVVPVFAGLEGERRRTGIVLATRGAPVRKLSDVAPGAAAPLDERFEKLLRAATPLQPRPADRVHEVALTGSMAGYQWGLNGVPYGEDKPLKVATGERVEVVMTNTTAMSHPNAPARTRLPGGRRRRPSLQWCDPRHCRGAAGPIDHHRIRCR